MSEMRDAFEKWAEDTKLSFAPDGRVYQGERAELAWLAYRAGYSDRAAIAQADERKAFEAEMARRGMARTYMGRYTDTGRYEDPEVQFGWELWSARATLVVRGVK